MKQNPALILTGMDLQSIFLDYKNFINDVLMQLLEFMIEQLIEWLLVKLSKKLNQSKRREDG